MRASGLAALAAVVLAVGCEANSGKPAAPGGMSGPAVELTEATADAIDRAVSERKGSVVLVDFWATWCPPCVERFPHLVGLHQKYSELGLVCVSISIDDPGKADAARAFLTRQKADFTNFLVTDYGTPEAGKLLRERYGLGNAIPFMTVIGRDGRRVWAGNGSQMTPDGLDAIIAREIDRQPAAPK